MGRISTTSVTLTDLELRSLKGREDGRYEVFDAKISGFAVRITPSGSKSFVVLYRQQGRQRRLTLGRYPVLSLADARRMALDALNGVAHGADPQQTKIDRRNRFGFAQAVESFLELHCTRRNRASTATHAASTLRRHFTARWATRDIREIRRVDVHAVIDQLMRNGRPASANRALAVVRKFFNWCIERSLIESSPCSGIKMPTPKRSRDRVLDDDELAAVWHAASETDYPYGAIVRLLILTAQRRHEVAGMRWSELDLDAATWSIPETRTKNGRPQHIPLSPPAVEMLKGLPQFDKDHVFPAVGKSDNAFSGFSKCKARLDASTDVRPWTLHDLRRTVATGMARLGVAPHVVERILNHVSGSLGGVAGIYNRFGYLPEMREALERWAAHIAKLAPPSTT